MTHPQHDPFWVGVSLSPRGVLNPARAPKGTPSLPRGSRGLWWGGPHSFMAHTDTGAGQILPRGLHLPRALVTQLSGNNQPRRAKGSHPG